VTVQVDKVRDETVAHDVRAVPIAAVHQPETTRE
jgi:hypothetical protein